jgi:GDP-4-dehydro-6-deoxy-D-mannose reductase
VIALVLGADGFVGHHLVRHLREHGDEVIAVGGPMSREGDSPGLDVVDRTQVRETVARARPEVIYHLAAVSFGPSAREAFARAVDITVAGTANVLEAAAACSPRPMVFVPGSSEAYGAPPDGARLSEELPLRPTNPYGVTKAAQEAITLNYGRVEGIPTIVTRTFNSIGTGQRDPFVVPSFARQLAEIHRGIRAPKISVGDLTRIRDFTDVRDTVAAYRMLVDQRVHGRPVNVASGKGVAIGDLLGTLIDLSGLEVSVEVDPALVRSHDPPRLVGDPGLLQRLTGWEPSYPLRETLREVWNQALERAAGSA